MRVVGRQSRRSPLRAIAITLPKREVLSQRLRYRCTDCILRRIAENPQGDPARLHFALVHRQENFGVFAVARTDADHLQPLIPLARQFVGDFSKQLEAD